MAEEFPFWMLPIVAHAELFLKAQNQIFKSLNEEMQSFY